MFVRAELYLCLSELNTLLLVPKKPITDLKMRSFIFWSIFGHGRGPYGLTQDFPAWDFFGDSWVHYQVIPSKKP